MEKLVCKFSGCTEHFRIQPAIRRPGVFVDTAEIARIDAVAAGWQLGEDGMWCPRHRLLVGAAPKDSQRRAPSRGKQNRAPRNDPRAQR